MGATTRESKPAFDFHRRSSGVLMHLTSLPGPHGNGDLGDEAHRFVDRLAEAGQTWWQVLPIGPAGRAPAFSPYDSASAFAGNPLLVSLSDLHRQKLLPPRDLRPAKGLSAGRVNFPVAERFRVERLRRAFATFRRRGGHHSRAYRAFCDRAADWLDDFALFAALKQSYGADRSWTTWDSRVRDRHPDALRAARKELADEIACQCFIQFQFDQQWRRLREHAHRRGIGLIGDLPIFVAQESADVWSNRKLFQLMRVGVPRRVSGYAPDRFNRRGQHWGHPQYDWAAHARSGFKWWVRRFERLFEQFDAVRIDHFLGFTRTWSIPADRESPASGRWVKSPGPQLFAAVEKKLGRRPVIAEDLGLVTPADVRLRDAFGLAPMRVLQFGLGSDADAAQHLPHNYPRLCAAYTGSHDLNTIVGWYRALPVDSVKRAMGFLGDQRARIHINAVRVLMASPANVVIFPMQDLLGLDRQARMNIPGTTEGNWRWRLTAHPSPTAARRLRAMTEAFCR
jgi:4-alpha-glucanotransferase